MLHVEDQTEMKDTSKITDERRPGWFYMDDAIIDVYGPVIGSTGVALYAALSRHANKSGECWPGIRRMAKLLALSPNTVIAHLQRMEELRLIAITRETDANGQHLSNTYRLLDPPLLEGGVSTIDTPPPGGGVSTIATGVSTIDTGVYQPSRQGVSTIATEGLQFKDDTVKDERTFPETWTVALSQLRGQMPQNTWENWLKGATAYQENGTLTIVAPNQYSHDWLSQRYGKIIERTVTSIDPTITTIAYTVRNGATP